MRYRSTFCRHARLDCPQPTEAQSANAAHSSSDRDLGRNRQHALARGAFSYVNKPSTPEGVGAALSQIKEYTSRRRKRLLIVEDNAAEQMSIRELLDHSDIEIITTDSGTAALSKLREGPCDCVVLDLRLPDMSGFEVLERIRKDESLSNVPVVVFTGRELSLEEDAELHTMARSIVVKGVKSPERLLDETSLFLHRVITELPVRSNGCWKSSTAPTKILLRKPYCLSTMTPGTFLH